jgi:hypothetical protein
MKSGNGQSCTHLEPYLHLVIAILGTSDKLAISLTKSHSVIYKDHMYIFGGYRYAEHILQSNNTVAMMRPLDRESIEMTSISTI